MTPPDDAQAALDDSALEQIATQSAVDALPATIADLAALVRIPSVSWPSFGLENVDRSAEAVAALFRETGVFERVSIERSPVDAADADGRGERGSANDADAELGNPAVLAVRRARGGKPTILLYAHHDVQPPGDESLWNSAPFEPTVRGDRLYGRGTADDKAGIITHVASIRALVDAVAEPELGIVVFVEGEEEFGSRSFGSFLERHRDVLAADVIVVADAGNWSTEVPALTVALRGNVTFRMTVSTLDHALHSGMFGGAVPDALMATIRMLATLWNEDGSVAVPGLSSAQLAEPDYDEARLREESGLLDSATPIGTGSILSRLWAQPSITVTGMDTVAVENASNTLQPSMSVRISTRVAPGQSARDAFAAVEAHLRAAAPFGASVQFDDLDTGEPFLVDSEGWAAREALQAFADAWETEPVQLGSGGSIPFIAQLAAVFPEAQILVTGVEDPDSRAHSPNESLHLPSLRRAILSETLLLTRLNSGRSGR